MNQLELFDKKNELQENLKSLIEGAESESRKLSEDEQATFNSLNEEIKGINEELRSLENKKEENTSTSNNNTPLKNHDVKMFSKALKISKINA